MQVLIDWGLIIFSTYIFIKAYIQALDKDKTRPTAFVLMAIYIFNCVPIVFNYFIGIPNYSFMYWYKQFRTAMNIEVVNVIYDIYIMVTILLLYHFALKKRYKIKQQTGKNRKWFFDNRYFWVLLAISPFLYLLLSGQFVDYLTYGGGKNGYTTTKYSNNFFNLYTYILLSCFGFCNLFFEKTIKKKDLFLLTLYSVALIFICGKRYIIAVLFIMYFFYFVKSEYYNERTKHLLERLLPIMGGIVVGFSAIYLLVFKQTASNMYIQGGLEALYDTLRVDFGRDDVTKYVIWKEFFRNEPILDYPMQSIISLLFMFVPRSIWVAKPYQHYQYLSSSILGLSINELPAGTTPSWFEMSVANMGILGFFIGPLILLFLCRKLDKIRSKSVSVISLMLVIALLTQGLDAYVGFLAILLIVAAIKPILGKRKLVLKTK